MTYIIHAAAPEDLADATRILIDATKWMHEKGYFNWGIDWWDMDTMERLRTRGELHVVKSEGKTIAVFCLQDHDKEIWPEKLDNRDGLYLHRIAVDREHISQGIPQEIVDWCKRKAANQGRDSLRLDCADRPKLVDIYNRLGFKVIDKVSWQENNLPAYHGVKMELAL